MVGRVGGEDGDGGAGLGGCHLLFSPATTSGETTDCNLIISLASEVSGVATVDVVCIQFLLCLRSDPDISCD